MTQLNFLRCLTTETYTSATPRWIPFIAFQFNLKSRNHRHKTFRTMKDLGLHSDSKLFCSVHHCSVR